MDFNQIIKDRAEHVFDIMRPRVSDFQLQKIQEAFELAREAHASQKRKTGEPYILHPIAVATIAAEELMLGAEPVIAAFLHDVVEDTDYTIEDIRERFGDDVAFLVRVVTKQKKTHYQYSKQVDNYRQMLESLEYDVRALLVKLADRLHNMRTLSSMRPDKQMKIAGETDYFYAPLANRLGFYNVKIELENLGFRFRCPHEYEELEGLIARDRESQKARLQVFADGLRTTLLEAGIVTEVTVEYRKPYSIWRKMHKYGDDFNHLKYRHFTDIIYERPLPGLSEKETALKIYSVLTERYKEKPGGICNYIDSPKENGYQSFHVKLLADFGRWQEVHISSRRMILDSKLGCVADRNDDNIKRWIEKFREVLRDIATHTSDDRGTNFIDSVVTSFYNDDIMTFTPSGKPIVLPQKATVLDFAYEVKPKLAEKAKYARINGFLSSIKAPLRRGDVVEIFTSDECHPKADWLNAVVTYKAKREIKRYLDNEPCSRFIRCQICNPIPGEEVVAFRKEEIRDDDNNDNNKCNCNICENEAVTLHKRDCREAIRLASLYGDSILAVDFEPTDKLYPVEVTVKGVDRYHLLIDLVECISNTLNLSIERLETNTIDSIVTITISFFVHSYAELQTVVSSISRISGVDEVKRSAYNDPASK